MRAHELTTEVEELDYVSKSKAKGFRGPRSVEALQKKLGLKKVLDQGNFSIWQGSRGTFGGKITMYYVVDNRIGEAQIQLLCNERNNVLSDLNLFAAPGNTIKAVDFYRILITKLNKVLVGDRQSPGSQAVWAKLNKFPDVGIHGWLDGKPVNIDTRDREYAYGSAASKTLRLNPTNGTMRQVSNDSPENRDARNMKLVAHKK